MTKRLLQRPEKQDVGDSALSTPEPSPVQGDYKQQTKHWMVAKLCEEGLAAGTARRQETEACGRYFTGSGLIGGLGLEPGVARSDEDQELERDLAVQLGLQCAHRRC